MLEALLKPVEGSAASASASANASSSSGGEAMAVEEIKSPSLPPIDTTVTPTDDSTSGLLDATQLDGSLFPTHPPSTLSVPPSPVASPPLTTLPPLPSDESTEKLNSANAWCQ